MLLGTNKKNILKFDEMFALFHEKYNLASTNGLTQRGFCTKKDLQLCEYFFFNKCLIFV